MTDKRWMQTRWGAWIDPGWLYIALGLVLAGAVVLLPAQASVARLDAQRVRLLDDEALLRARLEVHAEFLHELDAGNRGLFVRLAEDQLNLAPATWTPRLVTSYPSGTIADWLEQSARAIAPRRSREANAASILLALADGPARVWLLAASALCLLAGLVLTSDRARRAAAVPVGATPARRNAASARTAIPTPTGRRPARAAARRRHAAAPERLDPETASEPTVRAARPTPEVVIRARPERDADDEYTLVVDDAWTAEGVEASVPLPDAPAARDRVPGPFDGLGAVGFGILARGYGTVAADLSVRSPVGGFGRSFVPAAAEGVASSPAPPEQRDVHDAAADVEREATAADDVTETAVAVGAGATSATDRGAIVDPAAEDDDIVDEHEEGEAEDGDEVVDVESEHDDEYDDAYEDEDLEDDEDDEEDEDLDEDEDEDLEEDEDYEYEDEDDVDDDDEVEYEYEDDDDDVEYEEGDEEEEDGEEEEDEDEDEEDEEEGDDDVEYEDDDEDVEYEEGDEEEEDGEEDEDEDEEDEEEGDDDVEYEDDDEEDVDASYEDDEDVDDEEAGDEGDEEEAPDDDDEVEYEYEYVYVDVDEDEEPGDDEEWEYVDEDESESAAPAPT